MDLRQMRQFLVLAEERHFGHAAAKLNMAQPPLTRSIRALEDELGTALFVRTSKGAELTEAGKALLEDTPNILTLTQRAREHAQLAGAGFVGRLDVGIFSSGVLNVIPRLLAAFHTARPEVKIGFHNMGKAQQIQALQERRITIGFNRLVPEEPGIAVEPVQKESFLVAMYDGHPLSRKKRITLADLENEPMILYPNAPVHGLAEEVAAAFRSEGLRLTVEQEVEDVVTCIALVASRFGVAVTTESAANLRLPGVIYRPLDSRRLKEIELSCLYRQDNNSPILHAFLELIRQTRQRRARET